MPFLNLFVIKESLFQDALAAVHYHANIEKAFKGMYRMKMMIIFLGLMIGLRLVMFDDGSAEARDIRACKDAM